MIYESSYIIDIAGSKRVLEVVCIRISLEFCIGNFSDSAEGRHIELEADTEKRFNRQGLPLINNFLR